MSGRTVAVIDYGSGNLTSAAKALARASAEAGTGHRIEVTSDFRIVADAERIVLPGVGAFGDCKRGLAALTDMQETLAEAVIVRGRPFLGICVGMQLMAERGLEHGVHDGLGWIAGEIAPLAPADPALKIPHMGWNELIQTRRHPVLDGLWDAGGAGEKPLNPHAYFVHSYALSNPDPSQVLATAEYGGAFPAIVGRDNLVGAQFHPEKSQAVGLKLLANWLRWRP